MRILHIVGSLNRGGTETWLVQILRQIDRQKYQFDFLVHGHGPYDYQAEVEALGSRVIPCFSHKNVLRYSSSFIRVLRDFGPYNCVHVHVHYFSGLPLVLALRAGIPIRIVQSHTALSDTRANYMRRAYAWTMRRVIWHAATRGTAVSRRAADSIFPPGWQESDRWSTMPLGIDLEPFTGSVDRLEVRQELGIPHDAFVVGHVGTFRDQKNHSFLLDIAHELVMFAPNFKFLLLGEGPLRAKIELKARSLGLTRNVIFAGTRSDVPRVMKGAMDAFLFPSRCEGLGLAVLEAQAAGLPCVISDAVPEEANAGIGLVIRASLRDPPAYWAKTFLTFCASLDTSKEHSPVLAGFRSIENSAKELVELYRTSRS